MAWRGTDSLVLWAADRHSAPLVRALPLRGRAPRGRPVKGHIVTARTGRADRRSPWSDSASRHRPRARPPAWPAGAFARAFPSKCRDCHVNTREPGRQRRRAPGRGPGRYPGPTVRTPTARCASRAARRRASGKSNTCADSSKRPPARGNPAPGAGKPPGREAPGRRKNLRPGEAGTVRRPGALRALPGRRAYRRRGLGRPFPVSARGCGPAHHARLSRVVRARSGRRPTACAHSAGGGRELPPGRLSLERRLAARTRGRVPPGRRPRVRDAVGGPCYTRKKPPNRRSHGPRVLGPAVRARCP